MSEAYRQRYEVRVLRAATAAVSTALVDGVQVDAKPTCSACGRVVAEYLARPYSVRCKGCGAQVKRA